MVKRKKIIAIFTLLIFCSQFTSQAFAGKLTEKDQVNRISALEKEVAELKTMILKMQSKQIAADTVVSSRPASKKEGLTTETEQAVKLYGFVKLDSSFDSSRTDNPDAPKYVQSGTVGNEAWQYAMTAMNSRIGLKYYGPKVANADTFADVEIDFYDGNSDNSQKPRMRQAYFKLIYPRWEVLAGQTWDIFGPLGPNTLNTNGYLWYGGNIGFRRPQVRLTNKFDLNEDEKVVTQLSASRDIGISDSLGNTGENAGYPMFQGRAAYTFPVLETKSTIGVAGVYGGETYNRNTTGTSYDVPQWGLGLDFTSKINAWLSLKGEFFYGSNLDGLLAGIGQGINTIKEEGIGTKGGWVQLTCKPWEKCAFNTGYGIENLDKSDLNTGNRQRNQVIFANAMYTIIKDVKFGAEYTYFRTDYIDEAKGDDNRITTSLIYTF